MVQISRFFGIIISMYYQDHNPPHFHAEYDGKEIRVEIETLSILRWKLSPKATALVFERALQHQSELMENRDIMKHQGMLKKIAPLE
jgi:hypothetical protein